MHNLDLVEDSVYCLGPLEGPRLEWSVKRRILSLNWVTEVKELRWMAFCVMRWNQISTWLSQEELVVQKGLGTHQGLGLALLVDTRHHGVVGREEAEPKMSRTFSTKKGSMESWKCFCRWGWLWDAVQRR